MSTFVVERIKQITDCMVNESVSPLVKYSENIDYVIALLADFPSKNAYQKELIFLALVPVLGMEKSFLFANNYYEPAWQNILVRYKEFIDQKQIPYIKTAFADNSSQNQYLNVIHFVAEQYAYNHIQLKENDVVLDIGAGFGHFAIGAEMKNPAQIFSFESNPNMFPYLQENVENLEKHTVYPQYVLLTNQKGSVQYSLENETIEVEANTLDSWCEENFCKPNFIKITLDNQTIPCLLGAKNIIQKYKPQMAIVIGKKLNDMWEIPTLIKNFVPEYKLFCRKNAPYGDFILYASIIQIQ